MIGRRSLVSGLVTAAAVRRASAQQRDRPRVVGIAFAAGSVADLAGPNPVNPGVRSFVHGLRELGWVEGRNLIIERRTAEDRPERAPAVIAELIGSGAEVIVLSATSWLTEAARKTTSTVPLVAFFVGVDPATLGHVPSLARPGGNLTGVTGTSSGKELTRKRMELLKELAPRTTRIAWLGTESQMRLHPPDSGPAGTRIVHAVAETFDQFDQAFASILREGCDALLIGGTTVHFVQRSRIITFARQHRLPASYPYREAVADGGLMSYGPNLLRLWRQMAGLVDRILRGANPGDLPIELPDRFDLAINRMTAQTLGLTIPPSLEVAAEVIE